MSTIKPMIAAGAVAALLAASAPGLEAQTTEDSASHRTWNTTLPTPGGATQPTAPAPTTPAPTSATNSVRAALLADTSFIREAMAGNLLEVQLSNLAQSRASNQAVNQFGRQMAADHGAMQTQWAALVAQNSLPVSATLNAKQAQSVRWLQSLSGANFDRAYMSTMITDHQKDSSTFQRLGPTATSTQVRQYAATGLTIIEKHLSMARQLGNQVGASPPVAVVPPVQPPVPGTTPVRTTQPAQGSAAQRSRVKADHDFVQEVVADHVLELRMARLAEQKARDDDTRQFARQMANDFSHWQDRWTGMASRNDLQVSTGLGKKHREKLDKLEKASKKNFDRVYATTVADHLESVVPYIRDEGRSAHAGTVRNLAADELPTIRQHLNRARDLSNESKEHANASRKE